jgi:DNA-binding CsgD family transcriptional regulator
MFKPTQIAIILTDTLQSIGLRSLLSDYFSPVEITFFTSFDSFCASEKEMFDFYFTLPEIFVSHADFFLLRCKKTISIVHRTEEIKTAPHLNYLIINVPQECIIEQLRSIMHKDRDSTTSVESTKELSPRETDVLQQIVTGYTNTEIADKLCISLNTVLTHRKNIISKLGIKTVPGLTFYAITNGLISGNKIEV